MKFRNTLLVLCLVFAAGGSSALSLGAARGDVLLGQPLNVVLELQADADTTAEASCISAQAHFGDTPIEAGRLQIQALPAAAGRLPAVRIRTQALVNEPVVTLRVTAGCAGSTTRTYSFLADLPQPFTAGSAPVALPAFAVPPVTAAMVPPRAAARRVRDGATETGPAPAPAAQARPPRKAAPAGLPAGAKSAAPVVRPRLVLEPLEDWLSAPASLRLTTDLSSVPADAPDSAQRAQAAALWKSLNAESMPPQAAVPDAAAAAELAAAKAQAAQAQTTVAALERRLSRLEEERFSATVVYALLGLLLAALAAAAWLWRLARGRAPQEPGWRAAVEQRAAEVAAEPDSGSGRQRVVRMQSVAVSARAATETVRSELSGEGLPAPTPAPTPAPIPAPRAAAALPDFVATVPEVPKPPAALVAAQVVGPEDLFDLQQQAEFFISIGEHDQAIDVMRRHIAVNERTSPLAYLELLRLYRLLSRAEDFASLRAQFHVHFNAQVPVFSAFNRVSRSLLDYPDVLADIEAVWSDSAVVALLERCLFCSESGTESHTAIPRFELAAYDDLLLLYAIARSTPASARGLAPPRSRTTPQWLQAEPAHEERARPADDSNLLEFDLQPPLHHPLESRPSPLDIDLGEIGLASISTLPPLTQSDLPAHPLTPAPAPGDVLGFGANSDRFEARFDLEERKPGRH